MASHAGILNLSGIYLGKNIYVQNSFAANMKDFCCNDVYLNDVKLVMNVKTSAFEIDLSHLKLYEPLTIKITHKDDCVPKILNPQVIRASSSFQYVTFNVDEKHIKWTTKGEKKQSKFYIEYLIKDTWKSILEVSGKGSILHNEYLSEIKHQAGLNKYRVKYLESDGQISYSESMNFKYP